MCFHLSDRPRPVHRRAFLRAATVAAALPFTPWARAQAPETIEVGFMGLNGRGADLIKEFLATRRASVTWLCDVDQRALESAGKLVKEKQARPFKTSNDFRKVLEDRRLQALVIAAPDHWHAPAAILALQAGKHVYVEKPLSHNPREGEWLLEAARRGRTLVQVGLQRRSLPWVIDAMRLLRGGTIGEIHMARAWYANHRPGIGFGQIAAVPSWLDFGLWQGPAPERPFRDNILHYQWHWFWHWGTGELGNNGVHFLDLARWGMDVDCPTRVTSAGGRYFFDDDQETPDTQVVTFEFADRTIVWEHRSCQPQSLDGEAAGVAFYGKLGTLIVGGSGYRVLDLVGKETARVEGGVPTGPHVMNFLDCIQNPGRALNAPALEGNKSTMLCHLGNIAYRAKTDLLVNPSTVQLRNEKVAASFWSREYRDGWRPRV